MCKYDLLNCNRIEDRPDGKVHDLLDEREYCMQASLQPWGHCKQTTTDDPSVNTITNILDKSTNYRKHFMNLWSLAFVALLYHSQYWRQLVNVFNFLGESTYFKLGREILLYNSSWRCLRALSLGRMKASRLASSLR